MNTETKKLTQAQTDALRWEFNRRFYEGLKHEALRKQHQENGKSK
jgi:hypothetical protein